MSLESLKEQSEKIRSMSPKGSHIHWPLDFKRQVIKARSEGISGRAFMSSTGQILSRGSFWERLSTNRLGGSLLLLVTEAMRQMGVVAIGPKEITLLLQHLKVKGIFVSVE